MTIKQKMFCLYYVKYLNGTKAYQEAYGTGYNVSGVQASKLLQKEEIKQYINELLKTKKLPLLEQTNLNIKKCTQCGENLPFTKEYYFSNGKGGLRSYCKECGKKYNIYKKTKIGNIKEEIKMNSNKEKESALIKINSEVKKALELKKYTEGLKISDYVEQLLMENIEPKYFDEIRKCEEIRIQNELLKLSYSIEIDKDVYDSIFEANEALHIVHMGNEKDLGYTTGEMLKLEIIKKYKIEDVIKKIENKYQLNINKRFKGMSLIGAEIKEDIQALAIKVYAENKFSELIPFNEYKVKNYYPIGIQIILKPNYKEFGNVETIEIK